MWSGCTFKVPPWIHLGECALGSVHMFYLAPSQVEVKVCQKLRELGFSVKEFKFRISGSDEDHRMRDAPPPSVQQQQHKEL